MNQNTTNSLNQYTAATESNVQLDFSYDLDGSMTYRPVDATSGWTQVWNGENRMVETFKGSDRLTFRYDYMGRRERDLIGRVKPPAVSPGGAAHLRLGRSRRPRQAVIARQLSSCLVMFCRILSCFAFWRHGHLRLGKRA